jgi:hypothetical protein
MFWEKEWGKILFTNEGILEFNNFLKQNDIEINNGKINKNITLIDNTVHWLSEGDNAVTEDHEQHFNNLFWKWISNTYLFKKNEICIVNLIDQTLNQCPKEDQEIKISTILFTHDKSEELRYTTLHLYKENSYLFS